MTVTALPSLSEQIAKLQRRKAIAQRDLARKEPGSANYRKQKAKVARYDEKIAEARKAATHNLTRDSATDTCSARLEAQGLRARPSKPAPSSWFLPYWPAF